MSIQKLPQEKTESSLCNSCHSFYGTKATDWLCSSCFKKGKTNKCQETAHESKVQIKTPVVEKIEEKKEQVKQDLQKDRKKCFACSKKVGLLGTQCKCTFVFCNAHRLPEAHKCEFNFREKGVKELQKTVIKVDKSKIAQI